MIYPVPHRRFPPGEADSGAVHLHIPYQPGQPFLYRSGDDRTSRNHAHESE